MHAVRRALKAAAPYLKDIETDPEKWVPPDVPVGVPFDDPFLALQSALVNFSCSPSRKPYAPKTRARTIRQAIGAFAELRDALASLDYETQRHIAKLHGALNPESRSLLEQYGASLNYFEFSQRYWCECRAWIEGLTLLLDELPAPVAANNSKRPRDELIDHLRNLFAGYGRRRKGVNKAEQERRFVNAVLRAMGAPPIKDPARRVRVIRPKTKAGDSSSS